MCIRRRHKIQQRKESLRAGEPTLRVPGFRSCLASFLCLLAFAGNGLSASQDEDSTYLQYKAVRPMGMGNAFSAIADDGDAFYYNPAGLANARKIQIHLQPIRLIPSHDFYHEFKELDQLIDDIEAISESSEPLEDPSLEDERRRLTHRLDRLANENLGLDAASPIRFIVPLHIGDYGVAIGGMIHAWSESRFYVQRRGLDWSDSVKDILDDDIVYNIMAEASYGGAAAIEVPIPPLPLELSLGLAARRIYRRQMTDEGDPLGIEDLINPYGKDGIEGTADDFEVRYFDPSDPLASLSESKGYSIDVGAICSFDDTVSYAAVLRNLVGKIGDEETPKSFRVSAAMNLTKLLNPDIPTLDVILATDLSKDDVTQGINQIIDEARFGLELIWKLPSLELSGRIGSNSGYMTLGAGIQFIFLDFDYAFYGDQNTDWHAFSLNLAL